MLVDLGVLLKVFLDVVIDLTQLVFGNGGHHFPENGLLEVDKLDGRRVFVGKQVAVRLVALGKSLPLITKVGVEFIAFLTENTRICLRAGETSGFSWQLSVDRGSLGRYRGGGFCMVVKPPPELLYSSG